MINIFQFERKIKEQIDKERESDKKQKWQNNYNDQRQEMISKYKKRIMQFIDRVAKKPHEKGDEYSNRLDRAEKSFYKSKLLGDESIRLQHKFESARVKETEDRNKSLLDTVPNEILDTGDPLKLREREKIKEIVPAYRSRARGSMERLYDSIILDKGMSNIMRTDKLASPSFHQKITEHKENPKSFMNKTNGNHLLTPRNFLPDLHDKTHFKAAYTIMLNSQSCLQDKYGKTLFVKEQEKILKNSSNPKQSQNISLARFNKSISQKHGLNRHASNQDMRLHQQKSISNLDLNDRQDQSPSSQKRNDESLLNLLNDFSINKHVKNNSKQQSPLNFIKEKQNPQQMTFQNTFQFPDVQNAQPIQMQNLNMSLLNSSQLNYSKTLKKVQSSLNLRKSQQLQVQIQDESPTEQLLYSYRSKQEEPDNYLAWEYDQEGRKQAKDVIGIKKKHNFGELLDPSEEERYKSEFQRIQNKTKDMIANCNYVRKKHFKANTLRYGEGSLFMNKGVSNRDYENSIIKKSIQ
eukprot:403337055